MELRAKARKSIIEEAGFRVELVPIGTGPFTYLKVWDRKGQVIYMTDGQSDACIEAAYHHLRKAGKIK
jgi:hypothetical protein